MSNTTTATPPAPVTRSATKAAFTHIVDIILDNTNVTDALVHFDIDDIADILTLDDVAIEGLTNPDPDPNITQSDPLKRGEIGLLRTFIHFVQYREEINDPIDNKWTSIMFNQFRCNVNYMRRFTTLTNLQHIPIETNNPTPAPPASSVPKSSAPSLVDTFKRGIKRDPSVYATLKDELWNDNWHHSFANQARAQDVDEVLDPSYLPTTSEQYELFQEKQK
jgi:hypothetical protein